MSGATSLTQMQLLGVASETNVAEGYPRFALTPSQQAIVDRFPTLLANAVATPYPQLEATAHRTFFEALGQRSAPIGSGRILSFYSSTVATDVVAASLAGVVRRVGLVNPIIDCVPALLRHRGLELVPIGESRLGGPDPVGNLDLDVGAVITASPNNPTGTLLSPVALRRLADACAARGVVLVIDACFRAFDPRAQFDMYEILDASGVEYVVIEDSGKLWPVGGIKLGFLVVSAGSRLGVAEVAADILLTAPSFSVAVVEAFAHDMASGGMALLHQRIANNRAILRTALRGSIASVADGDSRVSVARVELPRGVSGIRLWGQLLRLGVHSVPCRPFYWARPAIGDRYLRVALAREAEVVQRAGEAIAMALAMESAA